VRAFRQIGRQQLAGLLRFAIDPNRFRGLSEFQSDRARLRHLELGGGIETHHAQILARDGALGQASGVLMAVHNTPFGDIVDTEDDLQPLVFAMFSDAERAVRLVAAAMASAQFNRERLAERAEQGWITLTELADTLVPSGSS